MEKNSRPLFTIITVVYNGGEDIERTLNSVIGQDFRNYEYIVVDGKSSDDTLDIVNRHKNGISRIISEKDNGVYDAMNKGVGVARAKYLFFLNAGDIFYGPGVLGKIAGRIDRTVREMYFGNVIIADKKRGFKKKMQEAICFKNLFRENLSHQSLFIHRDLFKKYGLFDVKYDIFADYEWNLRVMSRGVKPEYVDEIISVFRIGGMSTPDSPEKTHLAYREKYEIESRYYGGSEDYARYKKASLIFSKLPVFIRNRFIYRGFHKNIQEI